MESPLESKAGVDAACAPYGMVASRITAHSTIPGRFLGFMIIAPPSLRENLMRLHGLPSRSGRDVRIDYLPRAIGPISVFRTGPHIARIAQRVRGRRESGESVAEAPDLVRLSGLLALEGVYLISHGLHLHLELR